MNGKRRWRTSKETSGEACECTVTSGVLKEVKNGVAVRWEREIIVRRTPFARATASMGRVSDMASMKVQENRPE
jgi:hypothetical protein